MTDTSLSGAPAMSDTTVQGSGPLPIHATALLSAQKYAASTLSVHADDPLNSRLTDVAPPIHLSTTFRYPSTPNDLRPFTAADRPDLPTFPHQAPNEHVYSRMTSSTLTRLETILSSIISAPTLTYSSGLSAIHAALTFINPKTISIGGGYHGTHGVIRLHQRLTQAKVLPLDCAAEDLSKGDLIMLETPVNPTGEAFSIAAFAEKAHSRGAYLFVDSTFAPPPLQDPFKWGADIVMHSGTKYFGGHSDLLCGVLAVSERGVKEGWVEKLLYDREYLGSVMGGLEGWLGVRSLRTLELRVGRQSRSATNIVTTLSRLSAGEHVDGIKEGDAAIVKKVVKKIYHASLQNEPWLKEQMSGGFGPVFAIELVSEQIAKSLPSKLALFHHATSLGGVESLIEWRAMSDSTVSRALLRVSIGVEDERDLLEDILGGLRVLVEELKL